MRAALKAHLVCAVIEGEYRSVRPLFIAIGTCASGGFRDSSEEREPLLGDVFEGETVRLAYGLALHLLQARRIVNEPA